MNPKTPLSEIKGLAQKFVPRLKKLGLETVGDLILHFPSRYEDFSKIAKIADLKAGEEATVCGLVRQVRNRRSWRRRMAITEAVVSDESGAVRAIWFNQPYVGKILKVGQEVNLAGKLTSGKNGTYLSNPGYEIAGGRAPRHTAGLIPVYPETRGLTSRGLRYLIRTALEKTPPWPEFLPKEVLESAGFPEINEALRRVHLPSSSEEAALARKRFAFADLFLMQIINIGERLKLASYKAPVISADYDYLKSLLAKLPFELTPSQKKSLWEIIKDSELGRPMNRLLEGDVGSGKTVVAAVAALMAAKNGWQTAFLAPTEILARQHFKTLTKIFPDFEGGAGLITSSGAAVFWGAGLASEISKTALKKTVSNGEIKIVIGTHAIIQKDVLFPKLALVVVDEQHRFGVRQRAALLKNQKPPGADLAVPHFLSMSATPIPRTLMMAVFGDLDLSVIDELPAGRKKIITKVVAPENRAKAYQFVREQVKKGRQVFVICPRIETEDAEKKPNNETGRRKNWKEVKAVKEEYEKLSKKIFPDLKVAMLHGKMPAKTKEEIMKNFAGGETDVLVSTSVVEVGVNVPNASVMMIEGTERFGLAQLHQFRGRVGRAEHQSFCLLFSESASQTSINRLKAVVLAKNGLELAQKDLEIRGPGEVLGEKQSGLPDLAMQSLKNIELVKLARAEAEKILKTDPALKNRLVLKTQLEKFKKEIHLE